MQKKNCLMTGQSCPGLLCCLPQSVHCQIHHLQDIGLPWKNCYPSKRKSPAVNFTQKRRRTEETLEEPDWDHDPVDIKLFSPEEEKTISAGLDQSWSGVSLPTPERLTSSSEEEKDLKIKSIYVKVTKDERKTKERKKRKRKEKSKRKESKLSNTHTDRHGEKKNHTTSKKNK